MRHTTTLAVIGLAGMMGAGLTACEKKTEPAEQAAPEASAPAKTPLELARENAQAFAPLPTDWATPGQTEAQEDLGRMLYHDARLSKNHDVSCNSCHQLDAWGVDNLPTSPGHKKALGSRNSPTVYNAAGHSSQFWDGRAADVEEQAKGPVLNPVEMAMPDEASVVRTLTSIPGYVDAFARAFPGQEDPVTYDNFGRAVGAFERKLTTPSRWDAFLAGDDAALTADELAGFNLFASSGCAGCHAGALVGGSGFQKVGAVKPWPNLSDHGRLEVTRDPAHDMIFKAPSLRNVARTGPYFHDGSVDDLTVAVKMMGEHQLGLTLSDEDARLMVAWLETLTGQPDKEYIARPELPASGPDTPAPDPS